MFVLLYNRTHTYTYIIYILFINKLNKSRNLDIFHFWKIYHQYFRNNLVVDFDFTIHNVNVCLNTLTGLKNFSTGKFPELNLLGSVFIEMFLEVEKFNKTWIWWKSKWKFLNALLIISYRVQNLLLILCLIIYFLSK